MGRELFRRIALLALVGVFGTGAGVAFGFTGNGGDGGNGWTNKQDRGCPTQYSLYDISSRPDLANFDLNGDGMLSRKPASKPNLFIYVDNMSNH